MYGGLGVFFDKYKRYFHFFLPHQKRVAKLGKVWGGIFRQIINVRRHDFFFFPENVFDVPRHYPAR